MHVAPSTRPRIALGREWYGLSDAYGAWHAGWLVFVLVALVALLPAAATRVGPWAVALLVPFIGAYAYKLTIVMHECCHRTLFSSRTLNHAVGVLCGGILGSSFDVYCRVHWGHHRHCGTEDDGGENDYLSLQGAPPRALVLHLLKPLTGATFLEILKLTAAARPGGQRAGRAGATSGDPHPDVASDEAAEGSGAGLRDGKSREVERAPAAGPVPRRAHIVQLTAIVLVQACLALLASWGGRHPWLMLVFPLSAATFGLFFSRTRAFCEHVSATRGPGECFVRSHEPNPFDRLFFYTLNMNLHVEHHWFPQVPARHLPRLRAALKAGGHLTPEMTSGSILATVVGRLQESRARLARA